MSKKPGYGDLDEQIYQDISELKSTAINVPDASTTVKGIVQLSDSTSSTSSSTAATSNAVKSAYDLALSKANTNTATKTNDGLMSSPDKTKLDGIETNANNYSLPNATNSTKGGVIVGTNLTVTNGTISVANASTTTAGAVQLNNTLTSTSTSLALTANQGKTLKDLVDTKYVKPTNGIPKTDLSNDIQTSLSKADTALQSVSIATNSINGLMSSNDKSKLDGIQTGANNYSHPTGDGNLHVPATSTTNNGRVLKAGSTAGSISWAALTKTDVGLGNVDNTSDANKPISTATQTALNLKANLTSPTFTGTPTAPTATAGTNTTQLATTAFVSIAINNLPFDRMRLITVSTSNPSGGSNGDIWLKYE